MNVLILVQSLLAPPYKEMLKAQQRTWDSINVPGVETFFYYAGADKTQINGQEIMVKCETTYPMQHWNCKLAIDCIWDRDWHYLFRTNSSSYVDKKMLYDFAQKLPREKCYCGINGGGFASGCGVFLSRDSVKVYKDNCSPDPTPFEDCYMATILSREGISITPGAERVDFYYGGDKNRNTYHYRCKHDTDRTKDIEAFDYLFKRLKQERR